jgi:hypothetical protein
VETHLPLTTRVVLVVLEQQDAAAANAGDLAFAVEGGTLAQPQRVLGGTRAGLLYDVLETEPEALQLVVSAASREGWRLAGVVGLNGRAEEWARSMHGGVPRRLVPDTPLTPDGEIVVRLDREVIE